MAGHTASHSGTHVDSWKEPSPAFYEFFWYGHQTTHSLQNFVMETSRFQSDLQKLLRSTRFPLPSRQEAVVAES